MSNYVVWNGKIVSHQEVIISPDNHSFKYGDGCFETMKVINGQILLQHLHYERLFASLQILKFSRPGSMSASYFSGLIHELLHANHHTSSARIRLVVYRGNGGLYDQESNEPNFIIQSFPATHGSENYNEKGLIIDFFGDAKKATDRFASLKSNNYLPYVMGAIWSKENNLDDCIICNSYNRVADATIANIFIVKDGIIKTPAIAEGCIDGVMRRYLLDSCRNQNINVEESAIQPEELLQASEVFLTNATFGIRWVHKVGDCIYSQSISSSLHQKFIVPLFSSSTF